MVCLWISTLTIYLHARVRSKDAAGHSGQNKTVSRSAIKLLKIAQYSALFKSFVDLLFSKLSRDEIMWVIELKIDIIHTSVLSIV